ncbi:MAG: hypothetical protein ACI9T8_000624 [Candidatus Saccharimonadales bacterium]|jgi:hypothetical protein
MAKKSKLSHSNLDVTRVTRTIYFVMAFYITSIIIFDSGNLITRESVIRRWTIATIILILNTLIWYIASTKAKPHKDHISIIALTGTLLAFAGFSTYWDRGMASTSTILYALPILTIAVLRQRHALIAVTSMSAITYCFASVKYFNDFFNEGYRIQLWGHLILYSGIMFGLAWLVMIVAGLRRDSR